MSRVKIFGLLPSPEETDPNPIGVAYVRDFEGTFYPPEKRTVSELPFSTYDLRDGGYADYLTSDIAGGLYSERIRAVFENNKGDRDTFEWFPMTVANGFENKIYFYLHMIQSDGILDIENSKIVGANVIAIPAFKNISGRNIFCYADKGLNKPFFRENIKNDLKALRITGIAFKETRNATE